MKNCLVCDKDHTTSKCDSWRSTATSKSDLYVQALNLSQKICTWCLNPGHLLNKCICEEEVGCPCGSNFNMYICVNTPECKSRKNWTSHQTTVMSGSGHVSNPSSVTPNGDPMGKTLLPVQDIDTNCGYKFKTMFDNCSQTTSLSEVTAKKRNLKGIPVRYTLICTDGRQEPKVGKLYNLVLVDSNAKFLHI